MARKLIDNSVLKAGLALALTLPAALPGCNTVYPHQRLGSDSNAMRMGEAVNSMLESETYDNKSNYNEVVELR